MFTILGEFVALLFLQILGSKQDRQELSECLRHNAESLRQIHQQHRALVAQTTASTNSMLREAEEIFARTYSDYQDELNKQKAILRLPT